MRGNGTAKENKKENKNENKQKGSPMHVECVGDLGG
jgi:hypothetical protein